MKPTKAEIDAETERIRQRFVDWMLTHTVERGDERVCEIDSLSREYMEGFVRRGFCLQSNRPHQEGTLCIQAIKSTSSVGGNIAIVLVVDRISRVAEWKKARV